MSRLVVLDSGPLGLLAMRPGVAIADRCRSWFRDVEAAKIEVATSAVCDFEVRRELVRIGATAGLLRLDRYLARLRYMTIDGPAIRESSRLWAEARRQGMPTAAPDALDADVLIAAQALRETGTHRTVVVATTNAGHLSRFVNAQPWELIAP